MPNAVLNAAAVELGVCEWDDIGPKDVQTCGGETATISEAVPDPEYAAVLKHFKDAYGVPTRRSIPTTEDPGQLADRLRTATPNSEGPPVVVDTVGDVETLRQTLRQTWEAMGGRLVTLTTHHDRSFAPPLKHFVVGEKLLLGTRYATKDEVVRAARLLADRRITPIVSERVALSAVPAVHKRIRNGTSRGMVVLEP